MLEKENISSFYIDKGEEHYQSELLNKRLHLESMEFTLVFNRDVSKEDWISPGKFEIKTDVCSYCFDFLDTTGYIDNFVRNKVYFVLEHLDYESFPESSMINTSMFKSSNTEFTSFSVFDDDDPDTGLYVVKIEGLKVMFAVANEYELEIDCKHLEKSIDILFKNSVK